jgi:hypothetical protein
MNPITTFRRLQISHSRTTGESLDPTIYRKSPCRLTCLGKGPNEQNCGVWEIDAECLRQCYVGGGELGKIYTRTRETHVREELLHRLLPSAFSFFFYVSKLLLEKKGQDADLQVPLRRYSSYEISPTS